ncbi:hypothetical protein HK102_006439 [Quaeritorhiza haematococci]|nr:hypothetical protein HK102_006439 [Quaeritorhiza haematococci]
MIAKHAQNNRLDLPYLCRSEKVIQGYKDDKYVHDMISLQVLRDILEQGALLVTKASEFTLPVVTYHSPDDHFTCFDTSEEFIKKCGSTDKLHRSFPGAYHELHNEEDLKDGIIADYIQWITKRL